MQISRHGRSICPSCSGPWRSSKLCRHNIENLSGRGKLEKPREFSMTRQRRAIVIGGSMSGLLAAIMLRRRGWDVEVCERVERELADRGAGIVAQAELIARMNTLGLETRDLGVAMSTRKILAQSGSVTVTL